MGACAVILPNTNDNMEFGSEMLHSEADILYVGNDKPSPEGVGPVHPAQP